jgi:hypothetical protein
VWGGWYRHLFQTFSLPSYRDQLSPGDRLVIHGEPFDGIEAEYRELPRHGSPHEIMSRCHADALSLADGEAVAFIPPDCAISAGGLEAIRRRLDEGKRLIATICIRVGTEGGPRLSYEPRDLMAWALMNRHRMMRVSTWGSDPCSGWPSIVLFNAPCGAIGRAFHLHPIAVRGGRADYSNTIDDDLVAQFTPEETHVVTDSDELAFVEISPETRTMGEVNSPLGAEWIAHFGRQYANPMHRHFFGQRIVLRMQDGSDECEDREVADEVLARL